MFLQHAWMAVEDAGYTRGSLQIPHEHDQAGQVGVYVGVMYGEYNLSGSLASIANRVSYVLNLHGPSITLDTMCSSSLTAIHMACQDLRHGRTSLAIAGGVNVSIHPNKYMMLSNGQFISSDGHCQSFGEGGDGYIPGEGVGAVILKRLSEAEQDGDHIYGIIRGSAINHGGKTNGYSVPNPNAQASAISRALSESSTDPRQVSYIETHGTGTKLGDPIEITSMSKAFLQHTQDTGFCIIGSAKSNVGHCESAAGMAGLTKVLLQMKHQQIVPSLHSKRLNPHIDFEKTPFIVNQTLRTWDQPVINGNSLPRIAGLSSFGAGGSNAHIIIQEYLSPIEVNQPIALQDLEFLIPLSARTADQLKQKALDLLNFIHRSQEEKQATAPRKLVDLVAMAYTLQVGREAMAERLGFIVKSVDQLTEKLQTFINGEQNIEDVYLGQIKRDKDDMSLFGGDADLQENINQWISQKKLSKLIELWVKGLELDWKKLYGENKPPRISLPVYPFAKERYWIDPVIRGQLGVTGKTTAILHPLLHVNTSDLIEQSYSSTFNGEEFFLKDHQVIIDGGTGLKVLPAVAYLEMARAAIEKAMPALRESSILELHNIVWAQPIVVTANTQVVIALFSKNNEQIDYEIYSRDNGEEIIHCQGRAVVSNHQPAPAKLEIEQLKGQMRYGRLEAVSIYPIISRMGFNYGRAYQGITSIYQGERQLLAQLSLPAVVEESLKDYFLHPSLMDSALQASVGLIGNLSQSPNQPSLPFALGSVSVILPCTKEMYAWVRYVQNSNPNDKIIKLDIDLCDQHGNVCVQMREVAYQQESLNVTAQVSNQTISPATHQVPKQISIAPQITAPKKISINEPLLQTFAELELKKPSGISVVTLGDLTLENIEPTSAGKASVALSNTTFDFSIQESKASAPSSVSLFDSGNGIFSIQISSEENNNTLSKDLTQQLLQALDTVQQSASVKVLILHGTPQSFLSGGRKSYNDAVEQKLYQSITSFPYPVIASMQGDATGAGFLVGALCDFMICSQTGKYYYTDPQEGLYPSAGEDLLFKERFGEVRATDFLYISIVSTGKQLKEKGWNCPFLPQDQVEAYALTLASNLAKKSQDTLRLLKQHLTRHIVTLADALITVSALTNERQSDTVKADNNITSSSKQIQLETHAKSVLVIRVRSAKKETGIKTLVADLSAIFTQAKKARYRSIVLVSEYPDFLPETTSVNDVLDFQHLILESTLPVIAALDSNAKDMAWFISQCCDACVYSEKGSYSAANISQSPELAKLAAMIFSLRLGSYMGKEVLLTGNAYSGLELQQRVGNLMIAAQDQVLLTALQLAGSWARLPFDIIVSWKKEMVLSIRKKIKNLPAWLELKDENVKPLENKPVPVALNSKVVTATAHPEGILVVKMEDREAKNMFSEAIVQGMNEVFDHIEKTPSYKVVVLTGYDHYFASGGTKETLLAIQEGKTKFTDSKIYQITMTCKVPVIAAMQGHGVGAGWALGMFADFILFSEESKYLSPYMSYGFTPGAGATFIFPEKIGYDLGRETLLTAQEYSGSELKDRGLRIPVLPREQVYQAAMALAKQIANRSRSSLIAFKHQLTNHLHKPLEKTYKLELAMHEKTFVGQSDTLKQINDNFYLGNSDLHVETDIPEKVISASTLLSANSVMAIPSQDIDVLSAVTVSLRLLLAQELHLHEHEIDENIQFVDLGLDSITGVTWIREINEKYKTSIEATKIYSYPTLAQLSGYVKEEAVKAGTLPYKSKLSSIAAISDSSIQQQRDFVITDSSQNTDILHAVTVILRQLLAQELHLQEHEIDENTQFIDLGLDSITGVTWIRKINEKYKTSIEATKIYSYPTLAQLSGFVKEEAEKQGTLSNKLELSSPLRAADKAISQSAVKKLVSLRNRSASRQTHGTNSIYQSQSIAVIGISGKFPEAKNIEEFWQNIAAGKNCISEVSKKRWDLNTFYEEGDVVPGKTNCKWMGTLEEYDLFDPLFFNISPTEAECMDPQQRLFLQECWHAIENAGYNPKNLSGSKCGVFVGCASGDYHQLSKKEQLSAQGFTGAASSILSARISYFLNLQGPCLSIDTACSSSLVAIATACDSLNSGNSNLALAGGVCVLTTPAMHIMSSQTGMLSTDGRCFSFDQRANGFVPGEGVGVVMLKRLADAEKDQDMILGVIQGWGINQDGKTNGITAPNSESQTRLEQEIYDKYQIDPGNIQLVEAHGTGTKLGDPIEVDALKEAFKKYTLKKEYCALGSVKSNIGHCLTAAGSASFIKVLLALKHKQLPPTINYNNLNEHIALKDSPFYINNKLQDWNVVETERRQAAISAFGFSGTNAHIVIAEYLSPSEAKPTVSVISQNTKIIVPLSARTEEQLKQKACDLLDFIRNEKQSIDLVEMAYTLQVGRNAMGERLGFMVSSIEQLAEKLQAYIDGKENIEDAYQGQVKRNKEGMSIIGRDDEMKQAIVDQWIAQQKLSKLLDLWVRGLEFDWHKLYGNNKPRRIALPIYPFAKERYWFDSADIEQIIKTGTTSSVLHPLLHSNTSDLSQQRYSSTFSGEEFFLNDHQINGNKVLPSGACLEMVRVAIGLAIPDQPEQAVLELHNISWAQPVVVKGKKQITTAIFASSGEHLDYEIYSTEGDQEIIHLRGKAVFSSQPASSVNINIEQLKKEIKDILVPSDLYKTFARMGINFGPSLQGITAIYKGEKQLLVQLRLPAAVESSENDYQLHPSLVDSALLASASLFKDLDNTPGRPFLPHSLETVCILSACPKDMFAWVRYSPHNKPGDISIKLDIDLSDNEGNVCMQLRGFSSIISDLGSAKENDGLGTMLAVPVWKPAAILATSNANHSEYKQQHIILLGMPNINIELLGTSIQHSHCLSLQAAPLGNIAEQYSKAALDCFVLIQTILKDKPHGKVLVQIVIPNSGENSLFAGLSGLLQTAAMENPRLVGQIILTNPHVTEVELAEQLQHDATMPQDTAIKYTDTRNILQWQEVLANQGQTKIAFKDKGVYLITGGLGGLGVLFTKEIFKQTKNATVILTGRSELTAKKQAVLDQLTAHSGKVIYRQLDITNSVEVRQLVNEIIKDNKRLNGIIHSAGMISDNFILKKTAAEFSRVLEPKVIGTFNLDQASQDIGLDFFILFSSVAGAFCNPGQADYAAANGFMDQFASYRNQLVAGKKRQGHSLSINWSLWLEGGMSIDKTSNEVLQQTTGMQPIKTTTGMQTFYQSLEKQYDQVTVIEGILSRIKSSLIQEKNPPTVEVKEQSIPNIDPRLLHEKTLHKVKQLFGEAINLSSDKIDEHENLESYGIDSIMITKLNPKLARVFGNISKTLFFEYGTLAKLTSYFVQNYPNECLSWIGLEQPQSWQEIKKPDISSIKRLSTIKKERTYRVLSPVSSAGNQKQPIAIIGISGIYPQAANIDEYWENLKSGKNCISTIPGDRWSLEGFFEPDEQLAIDQAKSYSKWGGFVNQFSEFDALFFGISPREAMNMDPQERMFLQLSWHALESSGYTRNALQNKFMQKVGVFAGVTRPGYNLYRSAAAIIDEKFYPHTSFGSVANRLSYFLDITGPSMPVDTMCSSSLTAIHEACEHIYRGDCDLAFAGGVNFYVHPSSYVDMAAQHMFAKDGLCKSFGEGGNGFVPGEGVGVVLLRPLVDAIRDNDTIHGLILATNVNHGGKTNGYTVPNPKAQAELIRRTIDKAGISARDISYIEAHGTGTELGDPIEISGLQQAFAKDTQDTGYCKIGSAKSNIGHLEAAAGIAGITKVLLQMKYRQIVPSLHSTRLNPNIDFPKTPFVVNQTLTAWDQPIIDGKERPRIAGISAFGAGGANAHVIIQEFLHPAEETRSNAVVSPNTDVIIPLSAKSAEQLMQKAHDLLNFIGWSERNVKTQDKPAATLDTTIDLAAIAYTLQVGREAMEERLGFIVNSVEQLAEKLQAYINGESNIENMFQGIVKRKHAEINIFNQDDDMKEAISKWVASNKFSKLLDLWVKGLEFDWNKLYSDITPQRISLPVYPFSKERYWIDSLAWNQYSDRELVTNASFESIEDIINRIDNDSMDTEQAIKLLKNLS